MPTYEYECEKCGYRFEKFQKMTDKPVKVCPECKGRKVRKLISGGGGVIYKGAGFYTTEYRSEEYKKRAKQEKESVAASSKSPDTSAKTVSSGNAGGK
jgi:putative FmdB family regulatory protein